MAKSAISADVTAANSKLAQFLRRKEEEEALLQIGKRKPKQLKEEKRMPGGRARWAAEPDFRVPTCMVDRPRTATGSTSFHFSYISVSKQGVPTVGGKPIDGPLGKLRQAALEHSKYIERDGAAEVSSGAHHAAYVERPDVIESIDPSALIEEALERSISAIVNETPTEEEASFLGLRDVAPEGIPSVFSNISDDPFERQEYWRAVERCERTPKVHQIILDPEVSSQWWANLSANNLIEPGFKNHALTVAEKHRQYLDERAPDGGKKPFKAAPYSVSSERAGKLIHQSMAIPGFDHSNPPIEFKSGRGGRVQIRFVAELPHELSAEDRALIVQNFCDRLASLEERKDIDGTVRKVGMMYTAVIHAPDANNDSRNYHLHIVAHDRPAEYLPDHGLWDFEVKEYYTDFRKERVRYPFRQNKIGEVSQSEKATGKANSGQDFVPAMRREFSRITNAVLKARGVERRYDPRKYTEMGIDRTPTEHLGTKAAALEAIGVPTVVGQLNAIAIWNDAERSIERQAKQMDKAYHTAQRQLVDLANEATGADPGNPALPFMRSLLAERSTLIDGVAEDRRSIMAFDQMEAKAKSRAIRTRQTCLQFLADIESGKADGSTRVMKFAIQARWKDAQDHINKIDEALAPHRNALSEAAREIERRERRIVEIDRLLKPIRASVEHSISVASKARSNASTKVQGRAGPMPTQAAPVAIHDAPEAKRPGTPHAPLPPQAEVQNDGAAGALDTSPAAMTEEAEITVSEPAPQPTEEAEITVSDLAPVTIEGLPIVHPTIAPRPDMSDLTAEMTSPSGSEVPVNPSAIPEGLEALRPEPVVAPVDVTPEMVIEDISSDAPQSSPAGPIDQAATDIVGGHNEAPEPPARSSEPAAEASELVQGNDQSEKVDRRRKSPDPQLFDLVDQTAPVKPGTAHAEVSGWESLMKRIANNRIPIKVAKDAAGQHRYTVPSLNPNENKLLNARRFAHRTNNRLAAMHERQQHEIKRLVRWVSEHGKDPTKLIIVGRTAQLGDVGKAVRTLMKSWGPHPDVLAAVRAENDRREAAKYEAELAEQAWLSRQFRTASR